VTDRGSASILALGVALVVLLFAGGVAMAGGVTVARHRAETAADLGALAGAVHAADGEPAACVEAERVVHANGATLLGCRLDALDVTVTAAVQVPGGWGTASASARAGPLRATRRGADGTWTRGKAA
jgi:secretion/DNA translocation related TadE-like protein